jgi:hypothetical protein
MNLKESLTALHDALGYRSLRRAWAKAEIFLGLFGAGVGIFLGQWTARPGGEFPWGVAGAGLVLFVLGGYLALAGHRSHLYQAANERAAYLASLIHPSNDKG